MGEHHKGITDLSRRLGEHHKGINDLSRRLDELNNVIDDEKRLKRKIEEYENSFSWRITLPMRKIGKMIRNLRN